ncbi:D-alanine--D-alanine ligase [Solimicrobium silvestre]|nr:D-alanine--D-alanine ligase [Solimicrobium silvestre]
MTNVTINSAVQELGKVGVLFGGRSAEREVSIMSGTGVLSALQSLGVDAHAFDPGVQSLAELAEQKFDRVFIALHGRYGEDGTLQGALEQLGIPYTGSGVLASALAMDKAMTKRIWLASGLSTPKFAMLSGASDWAAIAQYLELPLIVKPAHEGSTMGLTKVTEVSQLPAAYALAARFDSAVIAEQFIEGIELTCAILGKDESAHALPLIRIAAPDANYDYQNKYFTDDTQYFCPSGLPEEQARAIQEMMVASYKVLGCRGWGRGDVMVRASDNKAFLLEMNTSPGMTGHSLVPMAARVAGLGYAELCLEILKMAELDLHVSADWKP